MCFYCDVLKYHCYQCKTYFLQPANSNMEWNIKPRGVSLTHRVNLMLFLMFSRGCIWSGFLVQLWFSLDNLVVKKTYKRVLRVSEVFCFLRTNRAISVQHFAELLSECIPPQERCWQCNEYVLRLLYLESPINAFSDWILAGRHLIFFLVV